MPKYMLLKVLETEAEVCLGVTCGAMGVCDTEMVEGLGVRMTGPWGPWRTGVPAGTC